MFALQIILKLFNHKFKLFKLKNAKLQTDLKDQVQICEEIQAKLTSNENLDNSKINELNVTP